jgi:energy-coupling factor transporter ATP-binding protein EcfA2
MCEERKPCRAFVVNSIHVSVVSKTGLPIENISELNLGMLRRVHRRRAADNSELSMESLLAVLGRLHLVDDIVELYEAEQNSIVILTGPSGCGKSGFGKTLGAEWIAKEGVCLTAEGDATKQHRDYFPLTYSFSALPRTWRTAIRRKSRGLATAVGSTLGTIASGGLVSHSLTDSLLGLLDVDPKEEFPFLSEPELSVLQALKRFAGKKQCLLMADDFQWWDQGSKDLLFLFHSDRLRSKLPVLAALRSLIILRESEDATSLAHHIEDTLESV